MHVLTKREKHMCVGMCVCVSVPAVFVYDVLVLLLQMLVGGEV